MEHKDKSLQWFIASIALHAFFWLALKDSALRLSDTEANKDTEIEVFYGQNSQRNVIVQPDQLKPDPDLAKRLKDRADYLGKITQRVKEQQVARPIDSTAPVISDRSAPLSVSPPQDRSAPPKGLPQPSVPQSSKGETADTNASRELTLPRIVGLQGGSGPRNIDENALSRSVVIGGGTQGEWIPGVKEGSFSALNTDQFTYYSFFSRVKQAIRFRWVTNIRNFAALASQTEIQRLAKTPSITEIEITLNKNGDVLKIITLRSSGSDELDQAAIKAFWQASPLNNPPAGIVEEDGFIRLKYAFRVIWNPNI